MLFRSRFRKGNNSNPSQKFSLHCDIDDDIEKKYLEQVETFLEDRKKEIVRTKCTHMYYELGLHTNWIVDWNSDGYRLPDTHEILLLSMLQHSSNKNRINLKQWGWFIKNSMRESTSKTSQSECDSSSFHVQSEDQQRLFSVLGEKISKELSLHETKMVGQKKKIGRAHV